MPAMTFEGRLTEAFKRQGKTTYCACLDCRKVYLDDLKLDAIIGAAVYCPVCGMVFRSGLSVKEAADLLSNGEVS